MASNESFEVGIGADWSAFEQDTAAAITRLTELARNSLKGLPKAAGASTPEALRQAGENAKIGADVFIERIIDDGADAGALRDIGRLQDLVRQVVAAFDTGAKTFEKMRASGAAVDRAAGAAASTGPGSLQAQFNTEKARARALERERDARLERGPFSSQRPRKEDFDVYQDLRNAARGKLGDTPKEQAENRRAFQRLLNERATHAADVREFELRDQQKQVSTAIKRGEPQRQGAVDAVNVEYDRLQAITKNRILSEDRLTKLAAEQALTKQALSLAERRAAVSLDAETLAGRFTEKRELRSGSALFTTGSTPSAVRDVLEAAGLDSRFTLNDAITPENIGQYRQVLRDAQHDPNQTPSSVRRIANYELALRDAAVETIRTPTGAEGRTRAELAAESRHIGLQDRLKEQEAQRKLDEEIRARSGPRTRVESSLTLKSYPELAGVPLPDVMRRAITGIGIDPDSFEGGHLFTSETMKSDDGRLALLTDLSQWRDQHLNPEYLNLQDSTREQQRTTGQVEPAEAARLAAVTQDLTTMGHYLVAIHGAEVTSTAVHEPGEAELTSTQIAARSRLETERAAREEGAEARRLRSQARRQQISAEEGLVYHGTAERFVGDRPHGIEGSLANLYESGFYTTESAKIANTYTAKGRVGSAWTPTVYGYRPRPGAIEGMIDLDKEVEQPTVHALGGYVRSIADEVVTHLEGLQRHAPNSTEANRIQQQLDVVRQQADRIENPTPDATGSLGTGGQYYKEVKGFFDLLGGADLIPSRLRGAVYSDDTEPLHLDLRRKLLEQGITGFSHEGGRVIGGGQRLKHPVRIFFDPENQLELADTQDASYEKALRQRNIARARIQSIERRLAAGEAPTSLVDDVRRPVTLESALNQARQGDDILSAYLDTKAVAAKRPRTELDEIARDQLNQENERLALRKSLREERTPAEETAAAKDRIAEESDKLRQAQLYRDLRYTSETPSGGSLVVEEARDRIETEHSHLVDQTFLREDPRYAGLQKARAHEQLQTEYDRLRESQYRRENPEFETHQVMQAQEAVLSERDRLREATFRRTTPDYDALITDRATGKLDDEADQRLEAQKRREALARRPELRTDAAKGTVDAELDTLKDRNAYFAAREQNPSIRAAEVKDKISALDDEAAGADTRRASAEYLSATKRATLSREQLRLAEEEQRNAVRGQLKDRQARSIVDKELTDSQLGGAVGRLYTAEGDPDATARRITRIREDADAAVATSRLRAGTEAQKAETLSASPEYTASLGKAAFYQKRITAQKERQLHEINAQERSLHEATNGLAGFDLAAEEAANAMKRQAHELRRNIAIVQATSQNQEGVRDLQIQHQVLRRQLLQQERAEATAAYRQLQGEGFASAGGRGDFVQRIQSYIASRQGRELRVPTDFQSGPQLLASRLLTSATFAISGFGIYGLVRGVSNAVQQAEEFERQMAIVEAQLRSTDQAAALPGFRRSVFEISRETGAAADDVAFVARQLLPVFGNPGRAAAETETAFKFAAVTGLEPKEINDSLTGTAVSFSKLDVEGQRVPITFQEIANNAIGLENRLGVLSAETVKFTADLAPLGAELGFTVEQLQAFGAVAQQTSGRSGAALSEQLSRALGSLKEKTPEIVGLFKGAGFDDIAKQIADGFNSGNFEQVLEATVAGAKNLSKTQQAGLVNIFGGRQATVFASLLANPDKLLAELHRGTNQDLNLLDDRWKQHEETVSLAFSRIRRAAEQFAATLFDAGISDGLRFVADAGTALLGVVNLLVQGLAGLNGMFGGIPGKILVAALAIRTLTGLLSGASGLLAAGGVQGVLSRSITGGIVAAGLTVPASVVATDLGATTAATTAATTGGLTASGLILPVGVRTEQEIAAAATVAPKVGAGSRLLQGFGIGGPAAFTAAGGGASGALAAVGTGGLLLASLAGLYLIQQQREKTQAGAKSLETSALGFTRSQLRAQIASPVSRNLTGFQNLNRLIAGVDQPRQILQASGLSRYGTNQVPAEIMAAWRSGAISDEQRDRLLSDASFAAGKTDDVGRGTAFQGVQTDLQKQISRGIEQDALVRTPANRNALDSFETLRTSTGASPVAGTGLVGWLRRNVLRQANDAGIAHTERVVTVNGKKIRGPINGDGFAALPSLGAIDAAVATAQAGLDAQNAQDVAAQSNAEQYLRLDQYAKGTKAFETGAKRAAFESGEIPLTEYLQAIRLERESYELLGPSGDPEIIQKIAELRRQEKDLLRDEATHTRNAAATLAKSLSLGDNVKLAQIDLYTAAKNLSAVKQQYGAAAAAGDPNALAYIAEAQAIVNDSKRNTDDAEFERRVNAPSLLATALLNAAGLQTEGLKKQMETLVAKQKALDARGAVDEAAALQPQIVQLQDQINAGLVSDVVGDLDFRRQMDEIGTTDYIQQLEAELNTPEVQSNKGRRQALELQIHNLRKQAGGDFVLPFEFSLPTLYEARRIGQTPGGVGGLVGGTSGYLDNRQVNVQIYVAKDADFDQVQRVLADSVGVNQRVFGVQAPPY